jgi:hypothetical protein
VRLAVNGHWVDLLATKPAQLVGHAVGNRVAVGHGRSQFGIQKPTEEEALDKARQFQAIAQQFFSFRNLLLAGFGPHRTCSGV